jgi:hypothetical protein
MIALDPHILAERAHARHEAIRALLLAYMAYGAHNPNRRRYPALEDAPDELLSVRLDQGAVQHHHAMSAEAYFALLVDLDLLDAHQLLHAQGASS